MDVKAGLQRKLSAEELMLLNCGVGDPTKRDGLVSSQYLADCSSNLLAV